MGLTLNSSQQINNENAKQDSIISTLSNQKFCFVKVQIEEQEILQKDQKIILFKQKLILL